MKSNKCRNCGATVFVDSKTCPNCGAKLKKNNLILLLVVALILLVLIINLSRQSDQKEDSTSPDSGVYSEQILFQNIPWGTSAADIAEQYGTSYFEGLTPKWSDSIRMLPVGTYSLGFNIMNYEGGEVAGYKVANQYMYFTYGHTEGTLSMDAADSELYYVAENFDVVDVEGTYNDLFEKLTSIYGAGNTTSSVTSSYSMNEGGFKSDMEITVWLGAENTGIKLIKSVPREGSPDNADMFNRFVTLCYGKTDSDDTVSELYDEYKDLIALQEQEARNPSNKSGL